MFEDYLLEMYKNTGGSPVLNKMFDLTASTREKYNRIQLEGVKKQYSLDGFEEALVQFVDGDSGVYLDKDGRKHQFRMNDFNPIDTADTLDSVLKSDQKRSIQPKYVASLFKKDIKDLTPDDYIQADNYHRVAVNKFLSDPNGEVEPFNPNIRYDLIDTKPVNLMIKRVSSNNTYDREKVEIINPLTQRNISFDISNNPYLNTAFNLNKSLDTHYNRVRLEAYNKEVDIQRKILLAREIAKDVLDTDSRIGEDIDLIKSTAYQSAARLLQHAPKWMGLNNKWWEEVADPETGQFLADAVAGVKPSTRKAYAKALQDSTEYFKNDEVLKGVLTLATNVDRLIMESIPQMALMFAGSVITGGITSGLGKLSGLTKEAIAAEKATKAYKLASAFNGATLAAIDQELINIEDYKKNHNGQSPDTSDIALNFLGNIGLLMPDALMQATGLEKFKKVFISGRKNIGEFAQLGLDIGKSFVGEALQERSQDTYNAVFTQKDTDSSGSYLKDLYETWKSPEQQTSFWAGGLSGATLTSLRAVPLARKEFKKHEEQRVLTERLESEDEANKKINIDGEELQDLKTTEELNETLNNINFISTKAEKFKNANNFNEMFSVYIKEVKKIKEDKNLSAFSYHQADILESKLIRQFLDYGVEKDEKTQKEMQSRLNELGISKEELLTKLFFNASDLRESFVKLNKRFPTQEEYAEIQERNLEKAIEYAPILGMTREEIIKTFKDVQKDIEFGIPAWGHTGYKTILQDLNILDNRVKNEDLTDDEELDLQEVAQKKVKKLYEILNNQVDKLNKFTQVLNAFDQDENISELSIPFLYSDKDLTISRGDIINNGVTRSKGTMMIFNDLMNKSLDIREAIDKELPKDLKPLFDKSFGTLESFKNTIDKINTLTYTSVSNIQNQYQEKIKTTPTEFESRLRKWEHPFKDLGVYKDLDKLSSDNYTDEVKSKIKSKYLSLPVKVLHDMRDWLIDNKHGDFDLTKQEDINRQQQYIDEIKSLINEHEATKQRATQVEEHNTKGIALLDKFFNKKDDGTYDTLNKDALEDLKTYSYKDLSNLLYNDYLDTITKGFYALKGKDRANKADAYRQLEKALLDTLNSVSENGSSKKKTSEETANTLFQDIKNKITDKKSLRQIAELLTHYSLDNVKNIVNTSNTTSKDEVFKHLKNLLFNEVKTIDPNNKDIKKLYKNLSSKQSLNDNSYGKQVLRGLEELKKDIDFSDKPNKTAKEVADRIHKVLQKRDKSKKLNTKIDSLAKNVALTGTSILHRATKKRNDRDEIQSHLAEAIVNEILKVDPKFQTVIDKYQKIAKQKKITSSKTKQLFEGLTKLVQTYNKLYPSTNPTNNIKELNVWYSNNENPHLSNLAKRPFYFTSDDGIRRSYFSVEHAYQSLKSGTFDEETYKKYFKVENNKYVYIDKKIKGKSAKTTDNYNIKLMKALMYQSFKQNIKSIHQLLDTKDAKFTHKQDTGIWKDEFPRILTEIRTYYSNPENTPIDYYYDKQKQSNINIVRRKAEYSPKYLEHHNPTPLLLVKPEINSENIIMITKGKEGVGPKNEQILSPTAIIGETFKYKDRFYISPLHAILTWKDGKFNEDIFNAFIEKRYKDAFNLANKLEYDKLNGYFTLKNIIRCAFSNGKRKDELLKTKDALLFVEEQGNQVSTSNHYYNKFLMDVREELKAGLDTGKLAELDEYNNRLTLEDTKTNKDRAKQDKVNVKIYPESTAKNLYKAITENQLSKEVGLYRLLKTYATAKEIKTIANLLKQLIQVTPEETRNKFKQQFLSSMQKLRDIYKGVETKEKQKELDEEDKEIEKDKDENDENDEEGGEEGGDTKEKYHHKYDEKELQDSNKHTVSSITGDLVAAGTFENEEMIKKILSYIKAKKYTLSDLQQITDILEEFTNDTPSLTKLYNFLSEVLKKNKKPNDGDSETTTTYKNNYDEDALKSNNTFPINTIVDDLILAGTKEDIEIVDKIWNYILAKDYQKGEMNYLFSRIKEVKDTTSTLTDIYNRILEEAKKRKNNPNKPAETKTGDKDKTPEEIQNETEQEAIKADLAEAKQKRIERNNRITEFYNNLDKKKQRVQTLQDTETDTTNNPIEVTNDNPEGSTATDTTDDNNSDYELDKTQKGETLIERKVKTIKLKDENGELKEVPLPYLSIIDPDNLNQNFSMLPSNILEAYTNNDENKLNDIAKKYFNGNKEALNNFINRVILIGENNTLLKDENGNIVTLDTIIAKTQQLIFNSLSTNDSCLKDSLLARVGFEGLDTDLKNDVKKLESLLSNKTPKILSSNPMLFSPSNLSRWVNDQAVKINDFYKFYLGKLEYKDENDLSIEAMWYKSPALTMLYKFKPSYNVFPNKPEFNRNTLAAIRLATYDFIANTDFQSLIKPSSISQISKMFGLNDSVLKGDPAAAYYLRNLTREQGIPQSSLVSRLGGSVLQYLGFIPSNKSLLGMYEKIRDELGMFCLQVLEKEGYLQLKTLYKEDLKDIPKSVPITDDIPIIKFMTNKYKRLSISTKNVRDKWLGKLDENGNTIEEGLEAKYGVTNVDLNIPIISNTPLKGHPSKKVKKTKGRSLIPDFNRLAMRRIERQKYLINNDMMDLMHLRDTDETIVEKYKTALYKKMGYIYQYELDDKGNYVETKEWSKLTKDQKSSQEGKNRQIETEIEDLIHFSNIQDKYNPNGYNGDIKDINGFYFKTFFSINGRIFFNSNTLNPQSNKELQRFLCMSEKNRATWVLNDHFDSDKEDFIKQKRYVAFAFAQAFKVLGLNEKPFYDLADKLYDLNLDQLTTLLDDLMLMDEDDFIAKHKDLGIKGIENFGQCCTAIQHLILRQKALTDPNNKSYKFKSWLSVEVDSTTSGYFIRLLQYVNPSVLKEVGTRVGIFNIDEELYYEDIHKSKERRLDIYKYTASRMTTKLKEYETELHGENPVLIEFTENEKSRISPLFLSNCFKTIFPALPKVGKDGKISKTLRNIVKPPTMVFGYSAGEFSTQKAVANDIMGKLITRYMDIHSEGSLEDYVKNHNIDKNSDEYQELKAVSDLFNNDLAECIKDFTNKNSIYKNMYELLQNKSITEIWVSVPGKGNQNVNRPLETVLQELLANTYGKAIWDSLSDIYKPLSEIANLQNMALSNLSAIYKDRVQKELREIQLNNPLELTDEKYEEVLLNNRDFAPIIVAPTNFINENEIEDKIYQANLVRFEKGTVEAPWNEYTYPYSNKKNTELETDPKTGNTTRRITGLSSSLDHNYAKSQVITLTKNAGGVVPIHYVDGAVMSYLLNLLPQVTPVHDAAVVSAQYSTLVPRVYNTAAYLISRDYDMFGNTMNVFTEALENMTNDEKFRYVTDSFGNEIKNTGELRKYHKMSFKRFGDILQNVASNNLALKQQFFSQPHFINNLDGIDGYVYIDPNEAFRPMDLHTKSKTSNKIGMPDKYRLENFANHILKYTKDYNSNYNGYIPTNDRIELLNDSLTTIDGRLRLVDRLQDLAKEMGNKVESDKYIQHVKDLLRVFDLELVKDFQVVLENNGYNSAGIRGENKKVYIGFEKKKKDKPLSIVSFQSPVELLSHELVHAATTTGIEYAKELGLEKEVNQILNLMTKVLKNTDWHIFMPTTYDPKYKDILEDMAKSTYNYILNNPKAGIAEFIAYGLTNETFMDVLKKIELPQKKEGSLFDKLLDFIHKIWEVLKGKKKIFEQFPTFGEKVMGRLSNKNEANIYGELVKLSFAMNKAIYKANSQLDKHPYTAVDRVYNFISDLIKNIFQKGNKFIIEHINELAQIMQFANHKEMIEMLKNSNLSTATRIEKLNEFLKKYNWLNPKNILKLAGEIAFNEQFRAAVIKFLQFSTHSTNQSLMFSILNEMGSPDQATRALHNIGIYTTMIDQKSKNIETLVKSQLHEAFGRFLSDAEHEALTEVALSYDLQSIHTLGYSVSDIKKLITDNKYLEEEIIQHETKIRGLIKGLKDSTKIYTNLHNQMYGLANYLLNGLSNEHQRLNAADIVTFESNTYTLSNEMFMDLVKEVDALTSMYALQYSDKNILKDIFVKLEDNGIKEFLNTHSKFLEQERNNYTEELEIGDKVERTKKIHQLPKGYVKPILDPNYSIITDLTQNKEALEKETYTTLYTFPKKGSVPELSLYIKKYANLKTRDGMTFINKGNFDMTELLSNTVYKLAKQIDDTDYLDEKQTLFDTFFYRTEKNRYDIKEKYNSKLMTFEEIQNLSSYITPVIRKNDDNTYKIVDYNVLLPKDIKLNTVGISTNSWDILSKMHGSQFSEAASNIVNNNLFTYLMNDMNENMNPDTHSHKTNFVNYVRIEIDSKNKFVRNAWKIIPPHIKQKLLTKEYVENDEKGNKIYKPANELWVREDWLESIFGNETLNAIDNRWIKMYPIPIKNMIKVAEYGLKIVASIVKTNILLKTPAVLLGNIISNLNYSILTGNNPWKVLKYTMANFKATKDYMETRRELDKLLMKQRLKGLTTLEEQLVNNLKSRIEHNRVTPLIKKGMFSVIIEDQNSNDIEYVNKVTKAIEKNPLFCKLPKKLVTAGRYIYGTSGTFIYDFMNQVTQFSDFAARCTEYQLQMERIEKKYKKGTDAWNKAEQQLTNNVWDAFINYNIPQNSFLQYLNDLGLVMFTKYFLRIQKVLRNSIVKYPLQSILYLITGLQFNFMDNIMEQNIFSKCYSALGHNPGTNIIEALTPMTLQYASGYKHMF